MIILFLVFLVQFGVSCSCLAMNQDQQVSSHRSLKLNSGDLGHQVGAINDQVEQKKQQAPELVG